MVWSLYEEDKFLKPLSFSNGKDQEEVVNEILQEIKKGEKIIFVRGVCGTGKSSIALHLAKEIGKTSIIVPGKNLQNQYKRDYEEKKFLRKKDGTKLKISVITGRRNHKCKFLEDNERAIPRVKKEINLKLYDIFEDKREKVNDLINSDLSAENNFIPCKIEIKEKNWNRIKEYLKENNKINIKDFEKISDVKRLSIAPVCPYWSPVLPEKYDMKISGTEEKKSYDGVGDSRCVFHKRKPGCSFYEQFNSYINSDVIVFNSMKYKLETVLGRKPKTELEVIDECDEFLDSFSNQSTINLDKLQNALVYYIPEGDDQKKVEEALALVNSIRRDTRIENMIKTKGILSLRETAVYDLLKLFLKESWIKNADDESYLYDTYETALEFAGFMNESYITASKKDNVLFLNIVTTNLAKKFEELVNKNKLFVLMSGTIHSENVLNEIFGLKNFKIIDAEIQSQGKIDIIKTGLEEDCKYANFTNNKISREKYLKALDKSLEIAKKPVLVHVNAFKDLPQEEEIDKYKLKNLISNEKIREMQNEDREGELIKNFKDGEMDILFSTRDSRGVDFPGEECNSIVFTKYPNPNVEDAFWKILMKTRPQHYWSFYRDKAKRELLQKLYRGLRFKDDHVYVLSPDSRVLDFFEKTF